MIPQTNQLIFHSKEPLSNQKQLGPYGLETFIPAAAEIHMTAYRVTVRPHSTTAIGYHKNAEEIYYVISGTGTAILDGEKRELAAGDFSDYLQAPRTASSLKRNH